MTDKVTPASKATTQNPKDLLGVKKVSMTKIPAPAIAHEAFAFMDGAGKYGPYNWRDKAVIASVYVDAAFRHITSWFEGEEFAEDSLAHHLGHARACLAILIDAMETGNLIDDRPVNDSSKGKYVQILHDLSKKITAKAEAKLAMEKAANAAEESRKESEKACEHAHYSIMARG